jgi:hypothetical protein
VVGIDPLDMASPSRGLQAADVATNDGFRILALSLKAVADALQVPARPVDTIVLLGIGCDVAAGLGQETTGATSTIMSCPTPSIRLASLNSM